MFKAGDSILTSQPFAHVILAQFRTKCCEYCFQCISTQHSCQMKCGMVMYCSIGCVEEDSKAHSLECELLLRSGSVRFFVDDRVRMILRILIKIKNSQTLGSEFYEEVPNNLNESSTIIKRSFNDLLDHASELNSKSKILIQEYWQQLETILPKENLPIHDLFVSVYGKILTNTFSLKTERLEIPDSIGLGLFLGASIFDHSCVANAIPIFHGRTLHIKAITDIPVQTPLNKIFISYINPLDCTTKRQLQLRAIWFFTCECELCYDSKTEDKIKNCICCQHCDGPVPINSDEDYAVSACLKCDAVPDDKAARVCYRELRHKIDHYSNQYEKEYEDILIQMMGLFHNLDVNLVKAAYNVLQWHFQNGRYQKCLEYAQLVEVSMEHHLKTCNDQQIAHLNLTTARVYGALKQDKEARQRLEKAKKIFRVIYGKNHPFYTQDVVNAI